MSSKVKYFIAVCTIAFCVSCNSGQTNKAKPEENKDQIALADSILFYFQQEQFDKIVSHFDEKIQMRLNKERLAVVWAQLNAEAGKYTGSKFYGTEKFDVGDKVIYQCNFGNQTLYFHLVFGKDNRVIGLFFKPQPI